MQSNRSISQRLSQTHPPQPTSASESRKTGELALLSRIRARSAEVSDPRVRLGIGDDCALLRPKTGEELAVTTDLSIEGRHFRLNWHPAESVGHRTLARGLSDLAAMGAQPTAAFLSLGLPRSLTLPDGDSSPWVERFLDGLLALAARYRVPLAGGDLAESPLALADIVLTGAVPQRKALLRSGARPGHLIYVTGSLGGAAAELIALEKSPESFANATSATADSPHLYPEPRISQGIWLRKHRVASAAMDLSDGLSTDLTHLCEESHVTAEVHADRLPLGPGATLDMALHGGEDYELLFTASPSANVPKMIAGVPVTLVGQVMPPPSSQSSAQPKVTLCTAGGREALVPHGWEHFAS